MKTLDISYDEKFYKEENKKSDRFFYARLKALFHLVILAFIYFIFCFLTCFMPNIKAYARIVGMMVSIIGSFIFFRPLLMKDGNIPDALDEAIALKETYEKNPELFFTDNKDMVALFDYREEDNFVYMPLKSYLKKTFKYEGEIPNEWNILHISVSNDGTVTITFS